MRKYKLLEEKSDIMKFNSSGKAAIIDNNTEINFEQIILMNCIQFQYIIHGTNLQSDHKDSVI